METYTIADCDVFLFTILLPVTVKLDVFIKNRGLIIMPYDFD